MNRRAEGHGQRRGRPAEPLVRQQPAESDDRALVVRHFDSERRAAREAVDAHRLGLQSQRQVVLQADDLADLDARCRLELVDRDHRARADAVDGAFDAELGAALPDRLARAAPARPPPHGARPRRTGADRAAAAHPWPRASRAGTGSPSDPRSTAAGSGAGRGGATVEVASVAPGGASSSDAVTRRTANFPSPDFSCTRSGRSISTSASSDEPARSAARCRCFATTRSRMPSFSRRSRLRARRSTSRLPSIDEPLAPGREELSQRRLDEQGRAHDDAGQKQEERAGEPRQPLHPAREQVAEQPARSQRLGAPLDLGEGQGEQRRQTDHEHRRRPARGR